MSQIPVDLDLIEVQRIKIKSLKAEEIEQGHRKQSYNIELKANNVTRNDYNEAQRQINDRIFFIGHKIWQANQILKSLEEKAGQRPILSADTNGAFAAVLLKIYKDPTKSTNLRRAAIAKYESAKDAPEGALICPITNAPQATEIMRAAQIVPLCLNVEIADYLFGPGRGARLHSTDNCLMMYGPLKKQFEKGYFVLLPVDVNESPITRWKVQITNDDARNAFVYNEPLSQYQGRELVFKNAARPAARFLYYHFVVTLLRNAYYRTGDYEHYCKILPTGKPFGTIGRCFRRSMLYALGRRVGDVNSIFRTMIENSEENIFDADQKLEDKEEEEIARRILNV